MIDAKMQERLNQHLNAELQAEYAYLAMAAYMESVDMPGAASWMRKQSAEEHAHAMKFFDHITERGGRVELLPLPAPRRDYETPLAAFEAALAHEQRVTGLINDLVDLALDMKDHAAHVFLQWFVSEQVEEEDSVGALVARFRRADSGAALNILDRHLATRE